jgi:hypothetical protein
MQELVADIKDWKHFSGNILAIMNRQVASPAAVFTEDFYLI